MNKKKAAAMAAVALFLQEEELLAEGADPAILPAHSINPWACFGRRTIARSNIMVQSKTLRTYGFRSADTNPEKGLMLQKAKTMAVDVCRPILYHPNARLKPNTVVKETKQKEKK